MSLGSQLYAALVEFGQSEASSYVQQQVQDDVTRLRRDGVDGVAVQDDTAAEILLRLYTPHQEEAAPAADSLTVQNQVIPNE